MYDGSDLCSEDHYSLCKCGDLAFHGSELISDPRYKCSDVLSTLPLYQNHVSTSCGYTILSQGDSLPEQLK